MSSPTPTTAFTAFLITGALWCASLAGLHAADAPAPAKASASASAAASAAAGTAAPKTYKVNISPVSKVGQKFAVTTDDSSTTNQQMAINAPGMATPMNQNDSEKVAGHLEADGEVLAVFPNGGFQKVSLTVKALTLTKDGQPMDGAPAAGAKIIAERDGKDIKITVDGKPTTGDVDDALGDLMPLDEAAHTDQDVYGPPGPVAIGDSWPINGDKLIERIKTTEGQEASNAKGTMKLDAVTGTGDDQVATISGNFSADVKADLPLPDLTLDDASETHTLTESVPATTTKGTLKQDETMTMKMVAHGATMGAQMKLSATVEAKQTSTLTFQ